MLPATRGYRTCCALQLFIQLQGLTAAAGTRQRSCQIQLQRCSTEEGIQGDMMTALQTVI